MVFQHYNLFRNKTVLQNITESLRTVQHLSRQEAEERAIYYLGKWAWRKSEIPIPILDLQ